MGNVLYRMSYSSIIARARISAPGSSMVTSTRSVEVARRRCMSAHCRSAASRNPHSTPGSRATALHDLRASHSPDIAIVKPVFFDGELVGFSANTAHHVDRRGDAGPLGHHHPRRLRRGHAAQRAGALQRRGAERSAVEVHPRQHPRPVMGDLEAQLAAAELGVQRFGQLLATYGKDTVLQATRQHGLHRGDARRCAKIPDGDLAEGFLETTGSIHRSRSRCASAATGSRSTPPGPRRRCRRPSTYPSNRLNQVACYFAFARAAARHLYPRRIHPAERGLVPRSRWWCSPPGSIFNPTAAAEARFAQIQRLVDLIIKALAPVCCGQVYGGTGRAVLCRLFRRRPKARTTGSSSK